LPDTTFEDAKRCPICDMPGEEVAVTKAKDSAGDVHIFRCENVRCREVGERWLVQTRPDGTVPQPTEDKGPKAFPSMSSDTVSRGMRVVEDAVGRDLRDSAELQ
jgi:hypothetical protein